ncbi:lysylphosphatidylglycerol synthase transmembrane domain-containing protein [Thermodesulfitimonas sp.]
MYRFLLAFLIFCAVFFLATHYTEGEKLLLTLKHGRPLWVLVALGLQVLFLFNQAGFYHAIYRAVGVKESWWRLLGLVTASAFVGLVTPGGALSGTALIVADAVSRGATLARAVLINLIFYLFDYGAFCIVLLGVFGYLWSSGHLTTYEEVAAGLLLAFVAGQVAVLAAAVHWPDKLIGLVRRGVRFAGRVIPPLRRETISDRAATFITHLAEAAQWLAARPHGLGRVVGHAFMVEALGLGTLGAVFLAFAGGVSPGTLFASYAVGVLFMIISITPSGIGSVEGAMTAALASFGVPPESAVLITFVYRGITVWLPFLAGIFSLRLVKRYNVAR